MALFGDLTHDSRVIREAESLAAAGHTVTIACLRASEATIERLAPAVRVLVHEPGGNAVLPGDPSPFLTGSASRIGKVVARARWLWRYWSSIRRWGRGVVTRVGPTDTWHAHDLTGLEAVVPRLDRATDIVYDSHELFLDTGSATRLPPLARRLLAWREGRLVDRCRAVITVNPGLAAELERRYQPATITVVRNCPVRWDQPTRRPDRIRQALELSPDDAIVLFHGALVPGRGIRALVGVLTRPGLERVHLVLLGYGSLETAEADDTSQPDGGSVRERVHVLPAVPPDQLLEWVASADVGAVLQEPLDRNLVLSTPNKLFESIAVGTPVLASDLPEIRRVVLQDPDGPLGVLCDPTDAASIGSALLDLLGERRELDAMRARCLRAADERLNWSVESERLLALYHG
jgi:glycosyltransferase involved in cell wall biosynthesis